MASCQLRQPDPFDLKDPDSWPKWKRRYLQYQEAAGLSDKGDARQINTLLYCLGEEANEILTSTNITTDERKVFATVLAKFDGYFKVRRNVIFERARFNLRNQLPGESAETYIAELYRLIEHYEYGNLDEMIRDRLVVGIADKKTSEHLQMDPALDLEKAKKTVRQKEAVREHGQVLEQDKKSSSTLQELEKSIAEMQTSLDEMRKNKSQQRGQYRGRRGGPQLSRRGGATSHSSQPCSRYGYTSHKPGDKCPASEATCHRCQGKGHFSTMCFTKLPAQQADVNFAFLDELNNHDQSSWKVTLHIGKTPIEFKIDTGAAVTAITETTYNALGRPALTKPNRVLCGPAQESLEVLRVLGVFQQRTAKMKLYVVKGLKNNLLGLPAITALQLLEKMCSVEHQAIQEQYQVFEGLGTFGDPYEIKIKDDAKPFSLYSPRSIPLAYRPKVKEELDRMLHLGVIRKVTEPTSWCAGMVVVPKSSGKVRICVDLKPLNQSVRREVYPLPTVDEILAQVSGAKIFSKLDANSGFWQIPLAEQSRPLTTFITPYGRFCFNKLPFGISSAPEVYQRRMQHILEGLPGVLCLIDDVLIFAQDQKEHDIRLANVLKRLQDAGVTLNSEKCQFNKRSIRFLGHIIDEHGIRADPDKTAAVRNMPTPTTITELRRFMGMVNQLGKFSHRIAQISQPLRTNLSVRNEWAWGPDQDQAFQAIKTELTDTPVLAMYDPQLPTKIATDASSYGLGAVLLQQHDDDWRPVAYASRAMTETERHYAQIEKEALGVTWACEKYRSYLLGIDFTIETDHKPLVPLLTTKSLSALPPRIIRFRLRLSSFTYTVVHVPGKFLYTADTLSRAPLDALVDMAEEEVEELGLAAVATLPASPHRLEVYRKAQRDDLVCQQLAEFCRSGWPKEFDPALQPFWKDRAQFSKCDDLLLFNSRIVVPKALQRETLGKIHQGHQGIERCQLRAKSAVWWPGITSQVKQMVQNCLVCAQNSHRRKAPLLTTPLPQYPWQTVASDLFELRGTHYLVVVDYFSRYPEIMKLTSTTSTSVISALKSVFARHGIPDVVRSDNGPQYSSGEFAAFAESYRFRHCTSSPHFPQSNGQAERMVQTAKRLLTSSNDPFLALMSYRATPLPWCGFSPSELSMGRRIRTTVPQTTKYLTPDWHYLPEFRRKNTEFKSKQKANYDSRHGVKESPTIPDDTEVWITTGSEPVRGTVTARAEQPRSYQVETPTGGNVRRNRSQLTVVPPDETSQESDPSPADARPNSPSPPRIIMTRSRTGNLAARPDYFGY